MVGKETSLAVTPAASGGKLTKVAKHAASRDAVRPVPHWRINEVSGLAPGGFHWQYGRRHFVRFYKAVHAVHEEGEDITGKTSAGSGTIPDLGGSAPPRTDSGCCPGVGLFRLIHSRQIEAGRAYLGGSFRSTCAGNVAVWLSIKDAISDIRGVP